MKAEPILDLRKLIVRCIWVETVFSEIESSCAISLLDSPLLHLIRNILSYIPNLIQ